jgi:putative phosphoribosyl transferase
MVFQDRTTAGRLLAEALRGRLGKQPIVLGLARGGVIVAGEVARVLGVPMDVLVVRKVGAPSFPEFGIGAVGPGGTRYFDRHSVEAVGLREDELDALAAKEEAEVRRRLAAYRGGRPDPALTGREVIIVDDGLATGVTAVAATEYVRSHKPSVVLLAAPVCSPSAAALLYRQDAEVVCLSRPEDFYAVGQWYTDFSQTTDEEVVGILQGLDSKGYLA